MPRILSRLLKKIAEHPQPPLEPFKRVTTRSPTRLLRKSIPPAPSFDPASLSESILLTPSNPISNSHDYARHKTLPPRIRVGKRAKTSEGETEGPRQMTEEECRWWSSPYLRMMSSPVRRCIVTNQYLPSDFLLRLSNMRLPSSKSNRFTRINQQLETVFVPDGLEHPKFKAREHGRARYILCWKDALQQLRERGLSRRLKVQVHSLLEKQIGHLLRLRVLQELQLVYEQLRYRPRKFATHTLIRRLTRAEWKEMQTSGTLPIDNAIAVLVVPPVSRNPATKQRPQASMSSHPPMEEAEKSPTNAPNRTMSTLYPTTTTESSQMSETLPTHQIPLYHGALAFPESSQRAALYELLSKILGVERNARYKAKMNTPESRSRKGENKYSHAFVLMSDENTIQFADTAAVALALWRLRMFEGMGWEGRVGWIKRYNHRSLLDFE